MKMLVMTPPLRRGKADEGRVLAALAVQVLRSLGGYQIAVTDAQQPPRRDLDAIQVCAGQDLAHCSRQVIEALGAGVPVVLMVPRLDPGIARRAPWRAAVMWSLAGCADCAAFASLGDRMTAAAVSDSRISALVAEPLAGISLPAPSGADFAAARGLGRFVLFDPPSDQACQAAQEPGLTCAGFSTSLAGRPAGSIVDLGALSPQERTDAYSSAAALVIDGSIESLRRAVEAAYCECPIVCPDTPLGREILGDGAHFYWAGQKGEGAIEQALAEALQAPRGDVVRARVLATGADRHPLLHLPQTYERAMASFGDGEKRSARLSQALALHALAWNDAASHWTKMYFEIQDRAADLHQRVQRLANLPIIRQILAIKRMLAK